MPNRALFFVSRVVGSSAWKISRRWSSAGWCAASWPSATCWLTLFVSLWLSATSTSAQVYRSDQIAYQLVLFQDGKFDNGTCGYPGYSPWNGWNCHRERGTWRASGDSIYLSLEFIDGIVAVNSRYAAGRRWGTDSLTLYFYDPSNGPFRYRWMGDTPTPTPKDTVYIYNHYPLAGWFVPGRNYGFYSGSVTDSTLWAWVKTGELVVGYLGTKSSTTGKITVRGWRLKP